VSLTAYLLVAESIPYEELKTFMLRLGGWEVRAISEDVYKFFVPFEEGYAIAYVEPNYIPKILDDYDMQEWDLIRKKLGADTKMLIELELSRDNEPAAYYEMAFDFCQKWLSVFQDVNEDILTGEEIKSRI